jgi:hypothetical protein
MSVGLHKRPPMPPPPPLREVREGCLAPLLLVPAAALILILQGLA